MLARLRAKQANRFIEERHRLGRILDIGCGNHPYFLTVTDFNDKHGLDKAVRANEAQIAEQLRITFHTLDIDSEPGLPFADESFDVVTMLAVAEHLEPTRAVAVFANIRRILRPDGRFILTTPAFWANYVLKGMARVRLLSPDEIDDHKALFSPRNTAARLREAGFEANRIRVGLFEAFMNIYAVATK